MATAAPSAPQSGGQNTFGQDISQAGGSIVPSGAPTSVTNVPTSSSPQPNPQTANGGAPPAIAVAPLSSPQTPINPPAQPSVNTGSSANAMIPTTAEATEPESAAGATPAEQAGTGILSSIANLMKGNTSLATLQTQQENAAGVPQAQEQITNMTAQQTALQNQLAQLQNEAAPGGALESAEQQEAQGRGITTGGLAPMSAADQRSNEIQQSNIVGQNLALGSTIASAQGNLTLSKTLADKAAQVQYDSTQQEIAYENSLLASIQPYITADQKSQADQATANLADRTTQVNAAIANRSAAISEVGKFAQIAPASVLQQMQNAPDAATVDQIAAANGLTVPVSGRYSSVQTTFGYGVLDSTTGQMVTGQSYPTAQAATQASNALNGGSASNTTSTGTANVVSAAGGSYNLSSYATAPGYTQAIQSLVNTMPQINSAATAQSYITQNYPNSPITGQMVMIAAQSSGVDPTVMMAIMQKETQMGTDGSAGSTGNNFGNVGNTDSAMAPGGSGSVAMNTPQAGVNAVASWLSNHQQQYNASTGGTVTTQAQGATGSGPAQLPIAQYGLLANTDFNPNASGQQGYIDSLAYNYINSTLQTGTPPSPRSMSSRMSPGLLSQVTNRANDLYFQATGKALGSSLTDVTAAQANLTSNLKLQAQLDNQVGTIQKNFGLNLANLNANNVNQAAPIINNLADAVSQALGYTSTAQYLAQNETIQNELGSLLAVKNAGGTTVADKISAGDLLPSDLSAAQQKQILSTLMTEAQNQQQSLAETNKGLYATVDPLNLDPKNPAQQSMIINNAMSSQNIDYNTFEAAVPAGQIGVMDNESGTFGYIDPSQFNPAVFTKT